MDGPVYHWLGRGMGDAGLRGDWAGAVEALAAAWLEGSIRDLVFHGTTARRVNSVSSRGMRPGGVMLRDEVARASGATYRFEAGTHWGTPALAAHYAEDRWLHDGRKPGDRPALLAVPIAVLIEAGTLVPDEPGMDMPCDLRVGRTMDDDAELARLAEAFGATAGSWQDCLAVYGSFCCLGEPPRGSLTRVSGIDDAARLLDAHGNAQPTIGRSRAR